MNRKREEVKKAQTGRGDPFEEAKRWPLPG
jgi:hypothetical protein